MMRVIGHERYVNDAYARALVDSGISCADAVVLLLDERDRLITELTKMKIEQPMPMFITPNTRLILFTPP